MMTFKKIIALICIISVLFVAFLPVVRASPVTTVKVETVTAEAGSDVEVAIALSGNESGILGMMVSVSYDKDLTLKSVVAGEALSSLDFTPGKDMTANPINIAWDGLDADSTNGTIAILTFSVPENAKETYNIDLTYSVGNIYDNDYNDIDVAIVNGGINVKNSTSKSEISIKNYSQGDTTTFTLDLVSSSSITGKILIATYYNKELILDNVKIYDAISSRNISVDTKGMETMKIFWWDSLSTLVPVTEVVEVDLTK